VHSPDHCDSSWFVPHSAVLLNNLTREITYICWPQQPSQRS